ncbi:hypothetical protein E2C01_066603 [Portunus trituberculatus]|uniref:Uncharacterized protein n=1 Tax=Portunus trituberculatus TaxID=210409 RepID=A0A5B7HV47_PORTR|nr:hypothetical protein [Portunus trituberculatus]
MRRGGVGTCRAIPETSNNKSLFFVETSPRGTCAATLYRRCGARQHCPSPLPAHPYSLFHSPSRPLRSPPVPPSLDLSPTHSLSSSSFRFTVLLT